MAYNAQYPLYSTFDATHFLEAPLIQQPSQRFHGAEPQVLYHTNSYGTHGYDLGPLPLPNNNDFTTFSMMDAPVDPDYVHSDRLLQDWDAYLITGIMPPVPRLHSDHHLSSSQCDQPFATNAPINMGLDSFTQPNHVFDDHVHAYNSFDSDFDIEDSSSSSLSSTPSPPSGSKPRTRAAPQPLPPHLQPIRIDPPPLLPCPMPRCGAMLKPRDTVWRSHFRSDHHVDFCALAPSGRCSGPGTGGRAGGCPGVAAVRCPFPAADGCAGTGGPCDARPMVLESVGRHWLNVHVGLQFRCPVCGTQARWREWACARHIRGCAAKAAAAERALLPPLATGKSKGKGKGRAAGESKGF